MDFKAKMKEIGQGIKYVIRGAQGLPPEEDHFAGMIDVKNLKERTRLNLHQVYAHAYMYECSAFYPKLMKDWETVAETEEHLLIALDGEQRKEAILYKQPRTEVVAVTPGAGAPLEPKGLEKSKGDKKE